LAATHNAGDPIVLGAYAARQCPLRVFRAYDPHETASPADPDAALQALFDEGHRFEDEVVAALEAAHPGQVTVIPDRDHGTASDRQAATESAVENGDRYIAGALLPIDRVGRRASEVDLLVRVGTTPMAGRWRYRPVDIKAHRATKNAALGSELVEGLDRVPVDRLLVPAYHEGDCLQLAHYYRHLETLGWHEPGDEEHGVWAGVIGSEQLLVWHDLTALAFPTTTPQEVVDENGERTMRFHRRMRSTRRSAFDRYDFEFRFRLDLVATAQARPSSTAPRPVEPVNTKECDRCPWHDECHSVLLERDDVSLVKGVGYPEWRLLNFMGVTTTQAAASLDSTAAALAFGDEPLKPAALIEIIGNARSYAAGGPLLRPDGEQHVVPRADVEIDLDLESTRERRTYLWGALVSRAPVNWSVTEGSYHPFVTWQPLDESTEADVFRQLWLWLREQLAEAARRGISLNVYGYNTASTEAAAMRSIVARGGSNLPTVDQLTDFVDYHLVDELPVMKRRWFSNAGHGLKVLAPHYGFDWHDDEAGGLNSIDWYEQVLAGTDPEAAKDRILRYNEDDCQATRSLRQ